MEGRAKDPDPGVLISPASVPVPSPDGDEGKQIQRQSASSPSLPKIEETEDVAVSSWWFASTAIPLLAATTGPLSNVLSIAALVTPWRVALPDNGQLPLGTDDNGAGIPDPHWEIILNALSLACGFTGNFFLLLNFTGRVRYIVALPLSIIFWVLSSIILISIAAAMHVHDPPISPGEIYSQGFWHAVLASILYFAGSLMLVVNMFGYVRGHYPQRFDLDDDQRTLILQTMLFFFWLAAGAGVYTRLEGWSYSNALYFADVSVLTVGFGDIYPTTNAGRGFLIVFELIGITSLGLVISSISRFVRDISANKIIKSHELHSHKSTLGRTVTNEKELRDRLGLPPTSKTPPGAAATETLSTKETAANGNSVLNPGTKHPTTAATTAISFGPDRRPGFTRMSTAATVPHTPAARQDPENRYGHIEIVGNTVTYHEHTNTVIVGGRGGAARRVAINRDDLDDMDGPTSRRPWKRRQRRRQQQKKLLLLREEKDRFNAMRAIQEETRQFKQYYALAMAVLAFGLLWFMGALVFMFSEERLQGLNYFEALYFSFVALLTIGYGDLSPKSNAGKAFFIVWSLIAVPTMTILIQELGATVVGTVNRGTFKLADWTVMPKKGLAKTFVANIRMWFWSVVEGHKRRLTQYGDQRRKHPAQTAAAAAEVEAVEKAAAAAREKRDLELYDEANVHQLARQLAAAIRDVAHDLGAEPPKRYDFEEWAHFAELIRFSRRREGEQAGEQAGEKAGEEDEGLIEWDWIGEDSPMLADTTEAQWVLDRLCESLNRYTRQQARKQVSSGKKSAMNEPAKVKEDSSAPSASSWASSSVSSSSANESPAY